jgi:Raf kinase inhibitor-like YbhB/YbcL family protein
MNLSPSLLPVLLAAFVSTAHAGGFTLTSPDVEEGGTIAKEQVFNAFGCTGENVSPALSWTGAPSDTKSFAVTLYDPDAPTGSGWWHWVIFNIPESVAELPKGAGDPASGKAPAGSVQSRTDYGTPGYGGPCPPEGDSPHHYIFTVYALNTDHLDIDKSASGAMVGFNLHATMIDKATLSATYGR